MKTNSIVIAILIVTICLLVSKTCNNTKIETHEVVRVDTIEVIKPVEKIVIQKAKPKIKYVRDTIVVAQPFIAQLDTIVHSDTISAKFLFPQNIFDIEIAHKADTFRLPQIVVSHKNQSNHPFDKFTPFVVGVALGFLIGKIK